MSRGALAYSLISIPLALAACGEAFTVVPGLGEAGASNELPLADGGDGPVGERPGVLVRTDGGGHGGVGAAGDASGAPGGAPTTIDAAGMAGSPLEPEPNGPLRCPVLPGEKLVLVGEHCIDENEVTAAHYQAFVDEKPSLAEQTVACAGNLTFATGCKFTDPEKQPVRCIDWCDAYAYCASVGKRLCGSSEGGSMPFDATADDASDQWYAACSHHGALTYPYGEDYDPKACWGADNPVPGTLTVKSAPQCEGGYEGVFDLSGGMAEWVDSCSADKGPTDACRIRGGSMSATAEQQRCDRYDATPRSTTSNYIGFRCCADARP
jgi:hypothetical protein